MPKSLKKVKEFAHEAEFICRRALRESENFWRKHKRLPANVVAY